MAAIFHTLDRAGSFPMPDGELSVAFLDAAAMGELHARYFDDPEPTDVITFPGDPMMKAAGEICVCPEVAANYAKRHNGAFAHELTLYLLHGYLHLSGHDDRTAAGRARMRHAERQGIRIIEAANAIPRFTWAKGTANPARP